MCQSKEVSCGLSPPFLTCAIDTSLSDLPRLSARPFFYQNPVDAKKTLTYGAVYKSAKSDRENWKEGSEMGPFFHCRGTSRICCFAPNKGKSAVIKGTKQQKRAELSQ